MGTHHTEHSTTPPGWADVALGAVAFVVVAEVVFQLVGLVKPELFSRAALQEMWFCGGLFFLVWATVGKMVFEPYVEAAIEREKLTVGATADAQKMHEEASQLERSLDAALRESRLEGIKLRDQQIELAKKRAAESLAEAKQQAAQKLELAQGELAQLRDNARAELAVESEKLTQAVVDAVVTEHRALH